MGKYLQRWWGAAALALVLAAPMAAQAWGEKGHRVTGLLAEGLLSAQARAGIKALMGKVDLGTEAIYLDVFKNALEQTNPGSRQWHYDDQPICEAAPKLEQYCQGGHCASVQLRRHYRVLIDAHSSAQAKRMALRVLVHLVGDIHQPLHTADHDDAGGNGLRVRYLLRGQWREEKLHAAWDSGFVAGAFDTPDERKIAAQLRTRFAAAMPAWQTGQINAWVAESHQLAKQLAYGGLGEAYACGAEPPAQALKLDDAYVSQATAAVPEQLAKAGARMAYLLNRAFAK